MKKSVIRKCIICLITVVFVLFFGFIGYIKAEYPVVYYDEIKKASSEFMVRESLIASVIQVESDYNALAVSKKGALGLMQIMPETAEFIAQELGVEDFNLGLLFDPKINIRFGAFYLNYLFRRYDNDLEVLYAYNAGEGSLLNAKRLGVELTIENITIKETKDYVNRVLMVERNYKNLYKIY